MNQSQLLAFCRLYETLTKVSYSHTYNKWFEGRENPKNNNRGKRNLKQQSEIFPKPETAQA